ncbi:hypothetical protein Mp_5g11230 [Marchantia polymorpha subsp. ruderalis]|uniref:Uncharacterized protein n=2 Tax=Marchantia polymorpha TaxID=3197 RepID=A0AAF6BH76_MARPO|nr:hypothetical protein MARPO_0093s0046 [Marchantia polymorpha]BBN11360.1 hypothetical protein Mp_5g11230 [Marchantia polymorpha subsp. ruderalis]|eukprot:PTQ32971.1 hypothetical protein MARPO_0093s0046 [Marchantia polymorpha]
MQAGTGSPARGASSSGSASAPQVQDDSVFNHLADELTFVADRKAETQQALMEDLVAALRKEEKLLDADAWKYAAPRSRRSDIS